MGPWTRLGRLAAAPALLALALLIAACGGSARTPTPAATPTGAPSLADLAAIPGALPDLRRADLPPGRYAARCARHAPACDAPLPRRAVAPAHAVACWSPL